MRGCGCATDSYPLGVRPSPPPPLERLGLGWPLAASQTLLASPNPPSLPNLSAIANPAHRLDTDIDSHDWETGSGPGSAALNVEPLLGGSLMGRRSRRAIDGPSPYLWAHNPESPPTKPRGPAPSSYGSSTGVWRRRAIAGLTSLSLRGLTSIMYPLSYPHRRHVLGRALRDALGDRRLAFVLFCKWIEKHPTTTAGLRAIFWAHHKLALAPSETPTPSFAGWDAPPRPRGEGLVRPSPQKGMVR